MGSFLKDADPSFRVALFGAGICCGLEARHRGRVGRGNARVGPPRTSSSIQFSRFEPDSHTAFALRGHAESWRIPSDSARAFEGRRRAECWQTPILVGSLRGRLPPACSSERPRTPGRFDNSDRTPADRIWRRSPRQVQRLWLLDGQHVVPSALRLIVFSFANSTPLAMRETSRVFHKQGVRLGALPALDFIGIREEAWQNAKGLLPHGESGSLMGTMP